MWFLLKLLMLSCFSNFLFKFVWLTYINSFILQISILSCFFFCLTNVYGSSYILNFAAYLTIRLYWIFLVFFSVFFCLFFVLEIVVFSCRFELKSKEIMNLSQQYREKRDRCPLFLSVLLKAYPTLRSFWNITSHT